MPRPHIKHGDPLRFTGAGFWQNTRYKNKFRVSANNIDAVEGSVSDVKFMWDRTVGPSTSPYKRGVEASKMVSHYCSHTDNSLREAKRLLFVVAQTRKTGVMREAEKIVTERGVVLDHDCYHAISNCYAGNGEATLVSTLSEEMCAAGLRPSTDMRFSLIRAHSVGSARASSFAAMNTALKNGAPGADLHNTTYLIRVCGDVGLAKTLFYSVAAEGRDAKLHAAVIRACCAAGDIATAQEFFLSFKQTQAFARHGITQRLGTEMIRAFSVVLDYDSASSLAGALGWNSIGMQAYVVLLRLAADQLLVTRDKLKWQEVATALLYKAQAVDCPTPAVFAAMMAVHLAAKDADKADGLAREVQERGLRPPAALDQFHILYARTLASAGRYSAARRVLVETGALERRLPSPGS